MGRKAFSIARIVVDPTQTNRSQNNYYPVLHFENQVKDLDLLITSIL